MKKSLLALAILGAFAGAASAQSNVTIYGEIDLGLTKSNNGTTTAMNNGDNSRLGFKGTEDLGGGLSANFRAEIRFDADTGTTEGNGTRPLFQGRTWVGLSGGFGAIRLGRDLTPKQLAAGDFDPWGADRNRGAFDPIVMDAGYVSDPLNPQNGAENRWSNALFYSTPNMGGFKADLAVATKENSEGTGGFAPVSHPYSVAATYANGPIGALAAYERNALQSAIWQVGGSYDFGVAKLMGTYAKTTKDSGVIVPAGIPAGVAGLDAKAWTLGAKVPVGIGRVLAAYGEEKPDAAGSTDIKKFAIGYEHPLSKRTFLYTDYINLKTTTRVNTFDVGINHVF